MPSPLPLPAFIALLALSSGVPASSVEADPAGVPNAAADSPAAQQSAAASAAHWREEAATRLAEGRVEESRHALLQLARAQQALGHHRDARATALRVATAAEPAGASFDLASALLAAGSAALALGELDASGTELRRAIELAQEIERPDVEAAARINLANLHAVLGEEDEALLAYEAAASEAASAGQPALEARALVNAARLATVRNDPQALARLESATTRTLALPRSRERAELLVSLGRSHRLGASARAARDSTEPVPVPTPSDPSESADPGRERAYLCLKNAASDANAASDERLASLAWGELGALYEDAGRDAEALELSRRALGVALSVGAPELAYRWYWQIGRLLQTSGDPDAALGSYRRAIDALRKVRREMERDPARGQTAFQQEIDPLYRGFVDLLLLPEPGDEDGPRLEEALTYLEELKAAELRDYFQDECVEQSEAQISRVPVPPRTLVVYPVPLEQRLELLLMLPDATTRRIRVPVARATLTTEVEALRRWLPRAGDRRYLQPAQHTYDWIVRPLEPLLEAYSIDTLVFVPDGPLRTIPMSALHDGDTFLLDHYAVAVTPGLELTDARPLDREHIEPFLIGLSEARFGYDALEHVPRELNAIHDRLGGAILMDADFDLETVERRLTDEDWSIVHIASHAEFRGDSTDSYLLAYDGRLTMDRLSDYVSRFRFRDTPLELLTLSACETAAGDERAALGLAGIAIQAGARSALGTLWKVNDAAAADLVAGFYEGLLNPSASKAQALRDAQRALRESAPSYGHPAFWAPFIIISNWM